MKPKQSIAGRSADANVLISEISRLNKGDFVSWEDMEAMIGRQLRGNSGILYTVKKNLTKEYGLVLSSRRGEGYEVCTDELVVDGVLAADRARRKRAAHKSGKKDGDVDLNNLTESQRLKLFAEIASACVTEEACLKKSIAKYTAELGGETKPLALNRALNALIRK